MLIDQTLSEGEFIEHPYYQWGHSLEQPTCKIFVTITSN